MDWAVTRVITQIPDDAWVGIKYPHTIWDQEEDRWVSDAEVTEIAFTAFTSRAQAEHISARLIVRRVKHLNPKTVPAGQDELFCVWRHDGGMVAATDDLRHRRGRDARGSGHIPQRGRAVVLHGRLTSLRGPARTRRATAIQRQRPRR